MRLEQFRTGVNLLAKCRLLLVESHSHIHILCSLSRKHEGDRSIYGLLETSKNALGIECLQSLDRLGKLLADDHASMGELGTPHLQGGGHIGQGKIGMLS